VDPLLVAIGLEAAATGIVDSGKLIAEVLGNWARGDEVTRLFSELDERFVDVPAVSAVGLAPLRSDTRFLYALAQFWRTGALPHDQMVDAIEPHLGVAGDLEPRQLAEQVVDAIDLFSARARRDERELFGIEALRQDMRNRIEALRVEVQRAAPARHTSVDWAPPLARDRLQRLLAEDPDEIAPLQDALDGLEDPRGTISGLINDPPPWLESAGHKRWSALGEVADAYGLWEDAAAAFLRASEMPGADRAMLIARAAADLGISGDEPQQRTLLARAQGLDPDHAQVILTTLRTVRDPNDRLRILDGAAPQPDERRQAAIGAARALAQLELRDLSSAEATLTEVASLDPGNLAVRELHPTLVLEQNRETASIGARIDSVGLRRSAERLKELRDDLIASFRYGESGRVLARAVEALALAGDEEKARSLLDEIRPEERDDHDAGFDLAAAAVAAGAFDRALALVPRETRTESEELARAQVAAFSNDPDAIAEAIPVLDRLLDAEEKAMREGAAFARQVAALQTGVDPSDRAQSVIEASTPALGALLAAEQLKHRGDDVGAETVLLPFHDDRRVLRTLIQWAAQRGEWDRMLELARAAVADEAVPVDRLMFADALKMTGRVGEAAAEAAALRRDETVTKELRTEAFALSAQLASEALDFETLERVTREWLNFAPTTQRAAWGGGGAALGFARAPEALEFADRRELQPRDLADAELLAATLEQGTDPETATRRLAELSDQFGRVERLEALFLMTALRVSPGDRLDDMGEQIRDRLAGFTERFPDSELIRSVPIDTSSPEGIDAFFRDHVEPGAQHVQEVSEKVANGELPLAGLAAALSKPVTVVTIQTERGLPLAFGDRLLASLEGQTATDAIGRSVVWDPVAVTVVAALGVELAECVRLALPASLVAQATLDDIARAADSIVDRDEYSVIGYDPSSDERWIRQRTAADVARERDGIEGAVRLARLLHARPDVDPSNPTDIDVFFADEDRDRGFATWPASVGLAQREGKPLYSDDRFVRAHARRAGVQAFGTVAALDAMAARGLIGEDVRIQARRLLRQRGGHGVGLTLDEAVEEARAAGWRLTEGLAFALLDPTQWNPDAVVDAFRLWTAFLQSAFAEAPERFEPWVLRVLDATRRGLPHRSYGFVAQAVLLVAWQPFRPEARGFIRALIRALREARTTFGWYRDPLSGAANNLMTLIGSGEMAEVQWTLAQSLLRDVDLLDALQLMGVSFSPR